MKKIIFIAAASLSLIGCRIDSNIDPNLPQAQDVSPREMLTAAETRAYDAQTTDMLALSNIWTNAWAGNEYYYAAPMTREYQMDVTNNFRNGIWNQNYLAMANLANIINNPKAADYPLHSAIAKILLANSMHYIVDFYGDAPYREAFKGQANVSPKYDKGEDIYKDLVLKLNDAIATIESTTVNNANTVKSGEDVIFGGDMAKWADFARTVKLRLLLRQSKVTDPTVRKFVDAELAKLSNASFVSSDVTINPGYSSATTSKQNPLYREYGWLTFDESAVADGYRYMGFASDHLAKLLSGNSAKPTSGVVDPRGVKMYRAVGGKVVGIVQGGGKVAGGTESTFSRLRWKYYQGAADGSSMDGYLMLKSEVELLLSEAAVLYPQYFSNAQGHYEQAIADSFTFYGATSSPSDYIAALSPKAVGWNGAPSKIAAIQYQRLIALNMCRPMETYINYLKTGYPETPLALTATQANKPWRLIYPVSEYVGNSGNVPNLTTNDVFVKNQYTPFWNRN